MTLCKQKKVSPLKRIFTMIAYVTPVMMLMVQHTAMAAGSTRIPLEGNTTLGRVKLAIEDCALKTYSALYPALAEQIVPQAFPDAIIYAQDRFQTKHDAPAKAVLLGGGVRYAPYAWDRDVRGEMELSQSMQGQLKLVFREGPNMEKPVIGTLSTSDIFPLVRYTNKEGGYDRLGQPDEDALILQGAFIEVSTSYPAPAPALNQSSGLSSISVDQQSYVICVQRWLRN